jgi:hypothetical protein
VRGWGVNISEDDRHWIGGLLQYTPSTGSGLRTQERGEAVDRETTQARNDGDRRHFIVEERRQEKNG